MSFFSPQRHGAGVGAGHARDRITKDWDENTEVTAPQGHRVFEMNFSVPPWLRDLCVPIQASEQIIAGMARPYSRYVLACDDLSSSGACLDD